VSKPRTSLTERQIAALVAEGRGQGEGENYRPWIRVARGELSSKGRSRRLKGITTGRIHHLLSDLEYYFFLIADFSFRVLDIREQYPLFPRRLVLELAEVLGIRHPVYPKTGVPFVFTTDFVLTLNSVETPHIAVSMKYLSSFAEDPGVFDRLELERRVWLLRHAPFWLVSEQDIPMQLVKNLDWLRQGAILPVRLQHLLPVFIEHVLKRSSDGELMRDYFDCLAPSLGVDSGDATHIFKHCVWTHQLKIDLEARLLPTEPLPIIRQPGATAANSQLWGTL
jgi:hypothetical protein